MSFSDVHNPSSGQCYDFSKQLVVVPGGNSGVKLTDYCNAMLTIHPAGIVYDAVPVGNTNQWICTRTLDILAVCVSTFQESDLIARIENGKVVCYQHD
jgi:hypothetical protein